MQMSMDFTEKGMPAVNRETCTGCGLCVDTCPEMVMELDEGKARAGKGEFLGCIACGQCVAVCPTESIAVSGRGMTADDRIDLPAHEQFATAEQLEALLVSRRSVRRFKDEEIDRATIDKILEMTATAPMGIPPSDVGVIVFHGRDRVKAMSDDAHASFARMARAFNPVAMTFMRLFVGREQHRLMREFVKPLLETLIEAHNKGLDGFTYNAPAAMIFHGPDSGELADCTIAATYAMLAAESLGLGSCMLGTTATFNHDKTLKAKYGFPADHKVGLGLILGHPTIKFHSAVRRRLGSVSFA